MSSNVVMLKIFFRDLKLIGSKKILTSTTDGIASNRFLNFQALPFENLISVVTSLVALLKSLNRY